MSSAVMLSIRPKWVEKVLSGEKTIEVRKARPKRQTPFTCYIYCSKTGYVSKSKENDVLVQKAYGMVIGEFVCRKIERYVLVGYTAFMEPAKYVRVEADGYSIGTQPNFDGMCMSNSEFCEYACNKDVYGWHISNVKIYDKPKPLTDFEKLTETRFGYMPSRLQRAPQSWCYVENTDVGASS